MDFEKVMVATTAAAFLAVCVVLSAAIYELFIDEVSCVNGVEYHRVNGKTFQTDSECISKGNK